MVEVYREQDTNIEVATSQEVTFTPQEIGFIKDAKRVISGHLARTILIVSAALVGAGIIAENEDSVKTAYAAPPAAQVDYPSPNPDVADQCGASRKIDFTPHSRTVYVGQSTYKAFRVDVCLPQQGHQVKLVEEDEFSDDTLETESVYITYDSARITYYLDCVDGGSILPNKIVGHSGSSQDFDGGADLAIEIDGATNEYDNVGTETGAAEMSCLDVSSTPIPAGVGGIAEMPDVKILPQDMTSEKSKDNTIPIAAGVAAGVAAAVTAAGAVLYTRRNRSA